MKTVYTTFFILIAVFIGGSWYLENNAQTATTQATVKKLYIVSKYREAAAYMADIQVESGEIVTYQPDDWHSLDVGQTGVLERRKGLHTTYTFIPEGQSKPKPEPNSLWKFAVLIPVLIAVWGGTRYILRTRRSNLEYVQWEPYVDSRPAEAPEPPPEPIPAPPEPLMEYPRKRDLEQN